MNETWLTFIQDKFNQDEKWQIVEWGEVIVLEPTPLFRREIEFSILFFFQDKMNLNNICFYSTKSKIILGLSDLVGMEGIKSYNYCIDNLSFINEMLDKIIRNGWKEEQFCYKDKCFRVNVYFLDKKYRGIYKLSVYKNLKYYFSLLRDLVFKDYDGIIYMSQNIRTKNIYINGYNKTLDQNSN